jgi:hypothetical protein
MHNQQAKTHELVRKVIQRKNIAREILTTERTYVDGLSFLDKVCLWFILLFFFIIFFFIYFILFYLFPYLFSFFFFFFFRILFNH